MAKKGKRKKSGESGQAGASIRPEAAAVESGVENSNVIQFPAKGARVAGTKTQIAIGSGTVVTHDEDDGGRDTDLGLGAPSEAPPPAEKSTRESAPPSAATPNQRLSTPTPSRGLAAVKGDGLSNTGEHAAVSDDFFGASPYPAQSTDDADDWGDLKIAEPISASTKRAMYATAAIAATFLLIGGIYLFVQKVVLPQPEELGGPPPVATLPTPIAAPEAPAEPLPPPAPVAAEPAVAAVAPAAEAPTEGAEPAVVAAPEAAPADPAAAPVPAPAEPAAAPPAAAAVAAAAPPAAPVGDVATLFAEAKRLRGARKIAALNDLVAANPMNAEILAVLGFEYIQRGDNRRALEFAQRAVAVDPTSSQGWITVGAAQEGLGNKGAAREAYRNCVERGQGAYVRECRAMR
jgi:hypothetical protein